MIIDKKAEKETTCYTYKVEMIIQVLAEDIESANAKLDEQGGYVSSRQVVLLNTNSVYVDEPNTAKDKSKKA